MKRFVFLAVLVPSVALLPHKQMLSSKSGEQLRAERLERELLEARENLQALTQALESKSEAFVQKAQRYQPVQAQSFRISGVLARGWGFLKSTGEVVIFAASLICAVMFLRSLCKKGSLRQDSSSNSESSKGGASPFSGPGVRLGTDSRKNTNIHTLRDPSR